jgi:ribonucleotide monophosphatase NagD (HAD superfamily)
VLESLRDRETIWMIGDNMTADVLGAKAFGLPSILVRKSHADAEYFCETLDLVPDVLQRECIG